MDGNTSADGYSHSRLQWSVLPCKPLDPVPNVGLCDGFNDSFNAGVKQQLPCGSRGVNPFMTRCGNADTLSQSMNNWIPGKPLGRQVGAPFLSTECRPEMITAPIARPDMLSSCSEGCQALYEQNVACKRREGPVIRYNYVCQCPSDGDCAGSGSDKGCCVGTCPVPNYREMLKAYPFC